MKRLISFMALALPMMLVSCGSSDNGDDNVIANELSQTSWQIPQPATPSDMSEIMVTQIVPSDASLTIGENTYVIGELIEQVKPMLQNIIAKIGNINFGADGYVTGSIDMGEGVFTLESGIVAYSSDNDVLTFKINWDLLVKQGVITSETRTLVKMLLPNGLSFNVDKSSDNMTLCLDKNMLNKALSGLIAYDNNNITGIMSYMDKVSELINSLTTCNLGFKLEIAYD